MRMGLVLGLGMTLSAAAGASTPTATVTMSQLSAAKRVYQRSTLTAGGQGKGSGSIAVSLSAATVVGTVYARCRASDGSTVIQAPWLAATLVATGAQTINVTGVDARLGWFYLDILDASGTWQNGTVLVGMGRGIALNGPSQIVRMLGKMSTYVGTNASLGVTISPNSSVLANYTDTARNSGTAAWAVPADSTDYDSTFVSQFLADQITLSGVNCFAVGNGQGGSALSAFIAGGSSNIKMRALLDAAGGFEAFYFVLGGNSFGTASATVIAGLTSIFTDAAAHNVARGSSFEKYVTATATRSDTSDSFTDVMNSRKDVSDWAAANTATYLEPHDITLVSDGVHQDQPGNITWANHLHRASYPTLGGSGSDAGPTLASGTRATNSLSLPVSVNLVASSALVSFGSPASRFAVYPSGNTTTPYPFDVATPITVASGTITLKLATDPGNTQALDVYAFPQPDPSATAAYTDMIYDGRTEDGQARGRSLQPTKLGSPIVLAAPGGAEASGTTATDTFTATDGTNITARACDTGQSWTAVTSSILVKSNRAYPNSSSVLYTLGWAPRISGNYKVTAAIRVVTFITAQNFYVVAHYVDTNNYFAAGYRAGAWIIGRNVNNTFSNYVTTPVTLVDGTDYAIDFRVYRDDKAPSTVTKLELWVDGSMVLSTTDTRFPGAGLGGIRVSGAASTTTTGAHFDSISMTDI